MALDPEVNHTHFEGVAVLVEAINLASHWHDRFSDNHTRLEELKELFNAYSPEERVKDEAWAIRTQWVELRRQRLVIDAKRFIAITNLANVTGNDISLWPAHLHLYHTPNRDPSQAGVIDVEACNVQ
jgi:hypothetical protein